MFYRRSRQVAFAGRTCSIAASGLCDSWHSFHTYVLQSKRNVEATITSRGRAVRHMAPSASLLVPINAMSNPREFFTWSCDDLILNRTDILLSTSSQSLALEANRFATDHQKEQGRSSRDYSLHATILFSRYCSSPQWTVNSNLIDWLIADSKPSKLILSFKTKKSPLKLPFCLVYSTIIN